MYVRPCMQVCTGVMIHGYPLVQTLCAELQEFMQGS
jgi:dihydropyrimidine dehydrogenase (NADP+)